MKVYIGVNSDESTMVISTVPLVRFINRQQADNEGIPYSYEDYHQKPHWIPYDKKSGDYKYGNYFAGKYVVLNKKFIRQLNLFMYLSVLELSWEKEPLEINL